MNIADTCMFSIPFFSRMVFKYLLLPYANWLLWRLHQDVSKSHRCISEDFDALILHSMILAPVTLEGLSSR